MVCVPSSASAPRRPRPARRRCSAAASAAQLPGRGRGAADPRAAPRGPSGRPLAGPARPQSREALLLRGVSVLFGGVAGEAPGRPPVARCALPGAAAASGAARRGPARGQCGDPERRGGTHAVVEEPGGRERLSDERRRPAVHVVGLPDARRRPRRRGPRRSRRRRQRRAEGRGGRRGELRRLRERLRRRRGAGGRRSGGGRICVARR
mmetsp:Transcript_152082/g.488317  ORF Transcript_152082/g.488317 Transcript_152082/m.488317 type:complete len:208 (+) Transcript_152082:507-1130(+)